MAWLAFLLLHLELAMVNSLVLLLDSTVPIGMTELDHWVDVRRTALLSVSGMEVHGLCVIKVDGLIWAWLRLGQSV